jgi:lipid A 3-O-deacylase
LTLCLSRTPGEPQEKVATGSRIAHLHSVASSISAFSRRLVKGFSASVLVLVAAGCALGQDQRSGSLPRGTWDFGISVGGGTGLFAASNTQFFVAGGRVGRVLTSDHLRGWGRGNFEYAAEFMPVFLVFQPGQTVYGGSFSPVIGKWNFTGNSRITPYLLLSAGGIVSASNVPRGNTSRVNFMPGGSAGVHIFTRRNHTRALTLETRWVHISNANLGAENPQLVSNFLFTVGYTWFKARSPD